MSEVRRVMAVRYFFTPAGPEYSKKLGRNVGMGLNSRARVVDNIGACQVGQAVKSWRGIPLASNLRVDAGEHCAVLRYRPVHAVRGFRIYYGVYDGIA